MRRIFDFLVKLFSSLGLSCTLVLLLGLLTWLGTLEQITTGLFEVQRKYFESFVLIHQAGPIPIPLPGANLVLSLLFVNVIVGGMVRIRRSKAIAGIFVTHIGIAVLLLSGFVKLYFSEDGHVTLYEGEQANTFQSYYRWELVISEDLGNGRFREHLVPEEDFIHAVDDNIVTLTSDALPFDVELGHFLRNCRPLQKGPMFEVDVPVVEGMFLREQPSDPTAEANLAGAYVNAVEKTSGQNHPAMLWGVASAPSTLQVEGNNFAIDLRHEQYPMPFTLRLDDFSKVDHPGISMPKSFSSDVGVIELGTERPVTISMNEPLRDRGLVLYQASWGPSNARPGDPLFSTFSVVRNPADQYPLYACIIISIGLLMHFLRKLSLYMKRENKKEAKAKGPMAVPAKALRSSAMILALLALAPDADARRQGQEEHGPGDGHDHGPVDGGAASERLAPWSDNVVALGRSLPIQEGGRVKPLDTFASITLLRLNGKRSAKTPEGERLTPVEWLLDAIYFPEVAADYPIFLIQNSEAAGAIGVDIAGKKKRDRYSFNELRDGIPQLFQFAHEYSRIEERDRSTLQQQVYLLAENVDSFIRVGSQMELAVVPPVSPVAAEPTWTSPAELFARLQRGETLSREHEEILEGFRGLAATRAEPAEFERELEGLHGRIVALAEARGEYDKIGLEVRYYDLGLITRGLYLFVLSFLVIAFMWLRPSSKLLYRLAWGTVSAAAALVVAAIVFRCVIRGRPPVSTLYESVLFVTAVGALVGLFIEWTNRQRIALSAVAILGMVGLFVANGFEMLDKRDTMPSLIAVLDTNFWLATHVTSITIGYSAGMLAALLASLYIVLKAVGFRRGDRSFFTGLGRMVYGIICFALIFSLVGTILGGVWANDSWGRFWGWDPKENGALLIVLSQIAMLHGRMGGYLREHGLCVAAAFGGSVIAFSWWGVNLLGVGLHSYGFTSGIHTALWSYYIFQWSIVAVGLITASVQRSLAASSGLDGAAVE
jgi:ABC-type transport system involved in cytochrome c biogenesis permease subunit